MRAPELGTNPDHAPSIARPATPVRADYRVGIPLSAIFGSLLSLWQLSQSLSAPSSSTSWPTTPTASGSRRKHFQTRSQRPVVPSIALNDDKDYVPTEKSVIFGHHFTSIAGTGPIVGPALAVIWGWVPALLWVLFGSILIGAVHDFGSLVDLDAQPGSNRR